MIPILQANLHYEPCGTREQHEDLLQQILQQKEKDPIGIDLSNNGCWRSEHKYNNIDWLIDGITSVANKQINLYNKLDPSFKQKLDNLQQLQHYYWTNVNKPGSNNYIHTHKGYTFTGCFYLQGNDTGLLTFHNPSNVLNECHHTSPFISQYQFNPNDGFIYMWPGWMPHEVTTNLSSKDRINISFNIWLT